MKICTLFSGSSGNCTYIKDDNTAILIDAGVSGAKIEKALDSIGENPGDIKAIFVTHEHQDHVSGVGILSRRYGIDIYGNQKTLAAARDCGVLKKIPDERIHFVEAGETCSIDNFGIKPYNIPHDAAAPLGYIVKAGGKRFAVATDIGCITDEIINNVTGCDAVLLEANHDIQMLDFGPYGFSLKQRIKGEKGHLSNNAAADFALLLAKNGTTNIMLGHLSPENNYPDLAYETVNAALKIDNVSGVKLSVAPRNEPSEWQEI